MVATLGIVTRFLYLSQIPTSLAHDEMGYVINAQSLLITGKGKSGEWSPFYLTPVESYLGELPAVFMAPFLSLPFSSLVNVRLIFVLMSLTLPIVVGLLCWELTSSKLAAYFTGIVALFNPWIWQNGRLAFDGFFSLYLYVLGIYLFIRNKDYHKLWALVPFVLGFYCYQGFKLILPFVAVVLAGYNLFVKQKFEPSKKKITVSSLLLIAIAVLMGFYFIFQFSRQEASLSRIEHQLLSPNHPRITSEVDTSRRLSLASPVNKIFLNKYTQLGKEVISRYMLVFGWRELFMEISASNTPYAVWNHGIFYIMDSVFIGFGIWYFLKRNQFLPLIFLVGLIFIAAIPATINDSLWFFFRASLIVPLFCILAGLGWYWLWQRSRLIFYTATAVYVVSIIHFSFIYFIRYPVFASENIYFSPRLLGEYLHRLPSSTPVVVFDHEPEFAFTSYIFYNNLFTKENATEIQNAYKTKLYSFGSVQFIDCIPADFQPSTSQVSIIDTRVPVCKSKEGEPPPRAGFLENDLFAITPSQPVFIKSIKDSGNDYSIYADPICEEPDKLNTFINPRSLAEFRFQTMTDFDFCKTWITKPLQI